MKRKKRYVSVMWQYLAIVSLLLVLVLGVMVVQYQGQVLPDMMCVELEFAE